MTISRTSYVLIIDESVTGYLDAKEVVFFLW